jgi:hypothetical protein
VIRSAASFQELQPRIASRHSPPRTLADRYGTGRTRQRHRLPGIGVVFLADQHHVDRSRESRLFGIRRIAAGDEDAPRGIEPALGVIVHVLAADDSSPR